MSCTLCQDKSYSLRAEVGSVRYLECEVCHLVYQNPMPDASSAGNLYQKKGYFVDPKKGTDYIGGEQWLRKTAKFFIRLIKKYWPGDFKEAKVLDFGCATGVFLDEIRKQGAIVQGIELSRWASAYAQSRFGLEILGQDIFELDLPKNHFDLITMIHSVEHLPDPVRVVERLVESLKPGGLLVIATPDVSSMGERFFGSRWQYYVPHDHLALFDKSSVTRLLKKVNLTLSGIEPYLWRRWGTLEALILFGIKWARAVVQGSSFPRGTPKDGLVVFSRKPGEMS
ncbi:MAG: class I SAM-dependent methyltransferase [Elusimicrobia bacterium]|nr:class I SAM-dependent methyltransferase [Elusimicrobiota bacterium]